MRHEREHPRIAQQQKQQNQSELLAAVSDRLREEEKIVAAPEPVAKEGIKNTSRSVEQRAKEVRELLLQQAQRAFGSDEKDKLHALALLKYAFTLADTSRVTEGLVQQCETAPKTDEVGRSFVQNVNDIAMSLLTKAVETFESMEKVHREWVFIRVDGGEGAHDRAGLVNAVEAIRNDALDFGMQITEFMRQLESTDDFETLKSATATFFAGANEMERATRELDHARSMFSSIIKKAEADGKRVRARVRSELAVLAEEATRLRDSASGDLKAAFELLSGQISSKFDETRALPVMDLLKALESDDFVSKYQVILDGLKGHLQPLNASKGVQPASATERTPKEKAEETLQQLLGVVMNQQKITNLQVDGIINQLSIICSVSSSPSNFFASIQEAKFNVPARIAEKWVNGLHFVKEGNVEGRCDTIRKILRVFEIAYIKQHPAAAAAGHIHTPWFALSRNPNVTDAGTAHLPNLIHAISSMYEDESDASALPPHSAYKFIRAVVANTAHEGKSELQGLVDTANRLIEKENELMDKLGLQIDPIDRIGRIEPVEIAPAPKPQGDAMHHADLCSAIRHYLTTVEAADFDAFASMLRGLRDWVYFRENTGGHKKEQPLLPNFESCYTDTTSLLHHLVNRMLVFDVDPKVTEEQFREATNLLVRIIGNFNQTRNFKRPGNLFAFDDHYIGATYSLFSIWEDVPRWKRANDREIMKYLEETIDTLARSSNVAAEEIFSDVKKLQTISVKAAVFVLSKLLSGDIHEIVYGIFKEIAGKVDKNARKRARQISAILKIIDSALIARGVFDHAGEIATAWMKVAVYFRSRNFPTDPNNIKTFMQTDDDPLHFPPYKAYAMLMSITTEAKYGVSPKRQICDFCKEMVPEMLKHDKALLLKSEAGATSLKDAVSNEIDASFGFTKRRKYAASPWTAV